MKDITERKMVWRWGVYQHHCWLMAGQVSLTRKYKAARKSISDIFRDIKRHDVEDKAVEINELHPSLKFNHNRDNNR